MTDRCAVRRLLGVPVAVTDRDGAVRRLDTALEAGEPLKVAFANAHMLNLAARDPEFCSALQTFFVLNDGLGVDIASRIKYGQPFPENLNGTDFTPYYLANSRHSLRIFMLGAAASSVEAAAAIFQRNNPRHTIAGLHHGYLTDDDTSRVCAMIAAAKADVVLTAMGNPLQELWIEYNAAATGAKLFLGVGALFDFTAGKVPRAPTWMRAMRCEWIYRLVKEPRRLWRRYVIGNARFLVSVWRDRHTVPPASPAQQIRPAP